MLENYTPNHRVSFGSVCKMYCSYLNTSGVEALLVLKKMIDSYLSLTSVIAYVCIMNRLGTFFIILKKKRHQQVHVKQPMVILTK
jgi:hypothetical protein